MERRRCRWVNLKNPRYIRYHDEEWGRPHYDDGYLFEPVSYTHLTLPTIA